MKSKFVLVLSATFAIGATLPALASKCDSGSCEVPNLSSTERHILENESKGFWKQIDWQPDAHSALKAAITQAKPILVVLSVGQRGNAESPFT